MFNEKEYRKEYRRKNREKLRNYSREYYRNNISKIWPKKISPWNKNSKMGIKQKQKISDTKKSKGDSKGIKNPGWIDGRWLNKDYVRWYNLQRLYKVKSKGKVSFEQWTNLKEKTGNICVCCKVSGSIEVLTMDHIIPISKRGMNTIDNIQPLCQSCNSRKFTHSINYLKLLV